MRYNVKFNLGYESREILSHLIEMDKESFYETIGDKYLDYHGDEVEENSDSHLTTAHVYKLKKRPSKKWCIDEIKSYLRAYGYSSIDDCITIEPFYDLAIELVQKHNL